MARRKVKDIKDIINNQTLIFKVFLIEDKLNQTRNYNQIQLRIS